MKLSLSEFITSLTPSVTLALTAKAAELKAQGIDVCSFTAGEPDFDTPAFIREAAASAVTGGGAVCHYTAATGTPELKRAVCDKFKRECNLSYEPSQIIVSNGAKQVLFNAIAALVNPGDEVIVPAPYWVSYPEMIAAVGGKPIIVDCMDQPNFAPNPNRIREALSPRTKALILCSPSNPTGAVLDHEQLAGIYHALENTNVVVISDEIYEHLVFDGLHHIAPATLNDDAYARTLTVNGLSKAYSMTGWRIGYAGGPQPLIKAMSTLQSHTTSNPATVSQIAALAALGGGLDEVEKMRLAFVERRDVLVEGLRSIEGMSCGQPRGAFYVFPRINELYREGMQGSVAFCQALLEKEAVATVPGAAFGADDFMRLSYACSMETIKRGVDRIAKFAKSVR